MSELTGYPTGMLAFDMDIERDLGIDSIKRVEILSTLEERLPVCSRLPRGHGPLKTLGQMIAHLGGSARPKPPLRRAAEAPDGAPRPPQDDAPAPAIEAAERRVVQLVELPAGRRERSGHPDRAQGLRD